MASFNGRACSVQVVDQDSCRVVVGDTSFLIHIAECEVSGGWFGDDVELVAVDGVLNLSNAEYAALNLRNQNSSVMRSVAFWIAAAVLFIAVLAGGVRLGAGPISRLIPLKTEAAWFPYTPPDNDELKTLLHEIPGTSGLHIGLDEDKDEVNAFALPGGSIRVSKGLVCFVKSPDELVGVIAHEVGHIHRRHVMRSIITTLGTQFLLVAFTGGGGGAISITESMLSREFSIADEREADEDAANALVAAGLSPSSLGDFFERMAKEKPTMLESILSDHPQTAARVAYFRSVKTQSQVQIDKRVAIPRATAWDQLRADNCHDNSQSETAD